MNGLSLDSHRKSPEEVLREWYYTTTARDEAEGNVPCLDFETQVACCCVVEFPVTLALHELNPHADALTIFYRVRAAYGGEVYVLGCVPYHALYHRLRGIIYEEDLVHYRTRAALPVFGGGEDASS